MLNSKALIGVLFSFLTIASCSARANQMKMYVLTPPTKAAIFTQELASLVEQLGLTPNIGQATSDRGHTVYVLEAKGRRMRIWSENMPLSGYEDPTQCGEYDEPHPDPGQFFVAVESIAPFIGKRRAAEIAAELQEGLSNLGYDVRETPVVCSSLSKMMAK